MIPTMFFAFLLCVAAVSAEIEDYRFTVTKNGQKVQKEVQINEKQGTFVMKLNEGNSVPTKTELHDLQTGYAAMKDGSNRCIVGKSPYTMNNMKDSLVAELKKNSSMAPNPIYMEDQHPVETTVLKQAGGKIENFCGSMAVLKATPKETRSKPRKDKRFCLGLCW